MEKVTNFPRRGITEGSYIPSLPYRLLSFSGQKFRLPTGENHVKYAPAGTNPYGKTESSEKRITYLPSRLNRRRAERFTRWNDVKTDCRQMAPQKFSANVFAGLSTDFSFFERRPGVSYISINGGKHDSLASGRRFTAESMIRSRTNEILRRKVIFAEERMNFSENKIHSETNEQDLNKINDVRLRANEVLRRKNKFDNKQIAYK